MFFLKNSIKKQQRTKWPWRSLKTWLIACHPEAALPSAPRPNPNHRHTPCSFLREILAPTGDQFTSRLRWLGGRQGSLHVTNEQILRRDGLSCCRGSPRKWPRGGPPGCPDKHLCKLFPLKGCGCLKLCSHRLWSGRDPSEIFQYKKCWLHLFRQKSSSGDLLSMHSSRMSSCPTVSECERRDWNTAQFPSNKNQENSFREFISLTSSHHFPTNWISKQFMQIKTYKY